MKQTQLTFHEYVPKERERTYYERVFSVPEDVCRLDICYEYRRCRETEVAPGVRLCREEAWEKLAEARERGAAVVLNHPFCHSCGRAGVTLPYGLELRHFGRSPAVRSWAKSPDPAGRRCFAWRDCKAVTRCV